MNFAFHLLCSTELTLLYYQCINIINLLNYFLNKILTVLQCDNTTGISVP